MPHMYRTSSWWRCGRHEVARSSPWLHGEKQGWLYHDLQRTLGDKFERRQGGEQGWLGLGKDCERRDIQAICREIFGNDVLKDPACDICFIIMHVYNITVLGPSGEGVHQWWGAHALDASKQPQVHPEKLDGPDSNREAGERRRLWWDPQDSSSVEETVRAAGGGGGLGLCIEAAYMVPQCQSQLL